MECVAVPFSPWTCSRSSSSCPAYSGRLRILAIFIAVFIVADFLHTVSSGCSSAVMELWAYSNPSTEDFTDSFTRFIHSDKGSNCRWLIISSHKEEVVELYFSDFRLKNASGTDKGDCLWIFDGPSLNDAKLLSVCSDTPQKKYVSSGREMLVLYERGDRQGDRGFKMTYVSKEVFSKATMIRIAGIVGACIFGAVLTFIVLRATRCCQCLLQSKNGDGIGRDIGGSTLATSARERDRLTQDEGGDPAVTVAGMRREARRVQGSAASINRLGVSTEPDSAGTAAVRVTIEGGSASALAPLARNEDEGEVPVPSQLDDGSSSSISEESSRGSRGEGDMDELPPSYESLFLDENGEKPPDYSPPKHRRKHPPRRVHTFN
ncbi:CUB domain-containing protein 2 [Elysia marginata]|uniref:CUB domain-containing protein 2 n=1 Tax=Elysia marginata TaxID=1093978 RepID=A0AAV4HDG2_9GAST|nr:CUB domain-containing protein 2 [Elysia marginata]